MYFKFLISISFLFLSISAIDAQEKSCEPLVDFPHPPFEYNCIRYFNDTASGVNNINVFLLAKLTELLYPDHLEYQIKYLNNESEPLDSIPSSSWNKKNDTINDDNFEEAYAARFRHYFLPAAYSSDHKNDSSENIKFRYIQKSHSAHYNFSGADYQSGFDPELMLISTPGLIIILFRGTDDVGENEWTEWVATDFKINQVNAGGALTGTKLHAGFWMNFDLIRDELIATLKEFKAENKKIWIAGHSLGAALSLISGAYLKSSGYEIENIYTYGCPRTTGNIAFAKKVKELLPGKVQRFEFSLDPVTLIWAPWNINQFTGQRNWYDNEEDGDFRLYKNIPERLILTGTLKKYPFIDLADKKEARRIKKDQMYALTPVGMKKLHYHSPQWYVKAAYHQLSESEKKLMPHIDDSYPYLYYYKKDGK
jgi:triacylglycerol lipase